NWWSAPPTAHPRRTAPAARARVVREAEPGSRSADEVGPFMKEAPVVFLSVPSARRLHAPVTCVQRFLQRTSRDAGDDCGVGPAGGGMLAGAMIALQTDVFPTTGRGEENAWTAPRSM